MTLNQWYINQLRSPEVSNLAVGGHHQIQLLHVHRHTLCDKGEERDRTERANAVSMCVWQVTALILLQGAAMALVGRRLVMPPPSPPLWPSLPPQNKAAFSPGMLSSSAAITTTSQFKAIKQLR